MGYKLKNRVLQKNLDDLTNGDFSRQLKDVTPMTDEDIINVSFGERVDKPIIGTFKPCRFTARFLTSELEEIQEYNPKDWNPFPEVTPPSEVDMRVELETGRGFQSWWDGENWRIGNHHYIKDEIIYGVRVFRPWED